MDINVERVKRMFLVLAEVGMQRSCGLADDLHFVASKCGPQFSKVDFSMGDGPPEDLRVSYTF
jgi:hypothetical protein